MLIAARSSQDFACSLTRNCKRALKIGFRFPCIRLSLLLRDSAGYTLEFRLIPASLIPSASDIASSISVTRHRLGPIADARRLIRWLYAGVQAHTSVPSFLPHHLVGLDSS